MPPATRREVPTSLTGRLTSDRAKGLCNGDQNPLEPHLAGGVIDKSPAPRLKEKRRHMRAAGKLFGHRAAQPSVHTLAAVVCQHHEIRTMAENELKEAARGLGARFQPS
jgi:hypothetical protein